MEWVETTGKDIDEAKELALDQLGVDEQDAEFEVLEEPRSGLFGRTRGVARVRARVLPRAPRPKQERRRRGRGGDGGNEKPEKTDRPVGAVAPKNGATTGARQKQAGSKQGGSRNAGGRAGEGGPRRRGTESASAATDAGQGPKEREMMDATEQCETVDEFLRGLSSAFGLETTVTSSVDDEGVIRSEVDGSEVGLLIGPRLGTLEAVQEICRNVLQRKADGREHGKVVLDVAHVREMRRQALEKFVTDAAETVRTDGREVVFEVMSSGDRKVVHDTVAGLDGVESTSIGEDPRRRVVVRPA